MGFSIRERSKQARPLRGQAGQTIIEYILVLIVIVGIILGVFYQFSSAFQVWATNYFGDYLTCLLETGELPSIGGTPGDSGVCNQLFSPFSLSSGRMAIPQIGSNSSSNGSNNSSSSSNPSGGHGLNEAASPPGGRYSSNGGGGGAGSTPWLGANSSHTNLANNQDNQEEEARDTGNISASSYGLESSGGRTRFSGNSGRFLDGRISMRNDDERPKGYRPGTAKSSSYIRTPSRMKLKPPPKKPEALPDTGGFSLANFLRLLLIAAIIIALIVLLGGQLLQVSKNMEAQ